MAEAVPSDDLAFDTRPDKSWSNGLLEQAIRTEWFGSIQPDGREQESPSFCRAIGASSRAEIPGRGDEEEQVGASIPSSYPEPVAHARGRESARRFADDGVDSRWGYLARNRVSRGTGGVPK